MAETTAAPRWSFWFRRDGGRRWSRIAEADTEDAAWARLFAHDEPGDKTVCRPGIDPNKPLGVGGRPS
jgi:hypothetical protein